MITKITDQTEVQGTPAPEKVVSISSNSTLDALTGGATTEKKDETTQVTETTETSQAAETANKDSATAQVDDSKTGEGGNGTGEAAPVKKIETEETEVEDQPLNLSDYDVEIDGQPVSLAEVVNERNAMKAQLEALAKDEFLKGFIDHYMATGNASAYLEAKGVDYDKKGDLDMIRMRFDQEHSDFSDRAKEILWKKTLAEKYNIKPELSEEDLKSESYLVGQELMKRDAKKVREELKETQKKFQITDRKVEQPKQFDPNAYKQQVMKEKAVESFLKSKILKLGVKDEAGTSYGYEQENTEQIIEMMADDRKFFSTFADFSKKTVDREKQLKIYAYALDPEKFEKQLVDFGKSLGLEERLKEEKNTDNRLNKQSTDAVTKETSVTKDILNKMLATKR